MSVGKRTSYITPEDDNFGFARWVKENEDELRALGPGRHYGEWWGSGIQKGYGLPKGERRFSLFNVKRWADDAPTEKVLEDGTIVPLPRRPGCCHVVPTLYKGPFDTRVIDTIMEKLRTEGSVAAPGWMHPEGIIVYHTASGTLFKKTLIKDEAPKALAKKAS